MCDPFKWLAINHSRLERKTVQEKKTVRERERIKEKKRRRKGREMEDFDRDDFTLMLRR